MVKITLICHDWGEGVLFIISDEKIITGLLSGGSVRRAAELAGCSVSTIRQRLQKAEFRQKYETEKAELLRAATGKLCESLSAAAEVLCSVMRDTSAPVGMRIQAADAALRHAARYYSLCDFERRLSALEANNETKL